MTYVWRYTVLTACVEASDKMKKAKIASFCGIVSALSIVFLLLGSILEMFDLTMVVAASVLLMITYEEMRYKSFYVYFVTFVLSLLICPNKLVGIEYGLFAIYPILRPLTNRLGKVFSILVRMVYAILASFGVSLLLHYIFLPFEPFWWIACYFVAMVVIFILFDVILKRFSIYYYGRLRKQLRIDRFFR